jgi:hypothetical protein
MFDVVSGREFDENRDDSKGDYLGGYLVEHYSVPTHYFYTSSWRFRKGEICVATDGIKYGISPEDYPVVCDRVLKVDPRNRTFLAYRYDEDGKDQARYDSWEQMRLEVGMRFQWIAPGCCPRTKDYWLQQDERLFYWEPGTRRPLYRIP